MWSYDGKSITRLLSNPRNLTSSRDESDVGGTDADDDDPDDVEPRTEDDDDLESSELVRHKPKRMFCLVEEAL